DLRERGSRVTGGRDRVGAPGDPLPVDAQPADVLLPFAVDSYPHRAGADWWLAEGDTGVVDAQRRGLLLGCGLDPRLVDAERRHRWRVVYPRLVDAEVGHVRTPSS